jgi:hypothetical protein
MLYRGETQLITQAQAQLCQCGYFASKPSPNPSAFASFSLSPRHSDTKISGIPRISGLVSARLERETEREPKMPAAAALPLLLLGLAAALLAGRPALATDPSVFLDWDVSYITASPLGVPQKVRFFLPSPHPLRSPFPTGRRRSVACVEQGATDEHTNQALSPEISIVSASLPSRFEI